MIFQAVWLFHRIRGHKNLPAEASDLSSKTESDRLQWHKTKSGRLQWHKTESDRLQWHKTESDRL